MRIRVRSYYFDIIDEYDADNKCYSSYIDHTCNVSSLERVLNKEEINALVPPTGTTISLALGFISYHEMLIETARQLELRTETFLI